MEHQKSDFPPHQIRSSHHLAMRRLQQLVHHISLYVAAFMAEIWVFVDYTSLYQYLRKPEEDRSFKLAMRNMHCMYAHECTITFRIEKLTPEDVFEKAIRDSETVTIFDATSNTVKPVLIENLIRNTTSYDERGWCIAEIEWSSDRASTGQHQVIDIVGNTRDALALKARVPTAPEDFGMNMKMAKFTHRSDEVQVISLQEKIFLEKVTRNETLSLEGLPRNELRALAQALPFFEVLQAIKLVGFDCGKEEAEEFVEAGDFWMKFDHTTCVSPSWAWPCTNNFFWKDLSGTHIIYHHI